MYRSIFFSGHCIKQIDSMLPWVCQVIDHRGRQHVAKKKLVTVSSYTLRAGATSSRYEMTCEKYCEK